MKETKGQGWTWLHDNGLTGPVAKGMVDGVARTRGDKVMAWGDREVTRWGWRWVTASDRLTRTAPLPLFSSVRLSYCHPFAIRPTRTSSSHQRSRAVTPLNSSWLWQHWCVCVSVWGEVLLVFGSVCVCACTSLCKTRRHFCSCACSPLSWARHTCGCLCLSHSSCNAPIFSLLCYLHCFLYLSVRVLCAFHSS